MGKQLHKRLPKEFIADIVDRFEQGKISEEQARELLGIGHTQLYRLRKQWVEAKGEISRFNLYRRTEYPTTNLPEDVNKFLHKELTYINEEAKHYKGKFNFELISERTDQEFGIKPHRNTIRRWAMNHGYYDGDIKKTRKVYIRFEMAGPGELYQHDSSNHIWLPDTGQQQEVILTEDDHSRLIVNGVLVEKETVWQHMKQTRETIEKYGMPLVYYVDRHSIFKFNDPHGVRVSYDREEEAITQYRRALESLGIGVSYTPKGEGSAKGKVEKRFDYLQRRVPFLCEKYHVKEVREGNKILREEVIPYYNERHVHEETGEIPQERWNKAIREGKSRLKPVPWGMNLDYVFALHYPRLVRKDGNIHFQKREWRVDDFIGERVTVALIPYKKFAILKDGQKIWEYHL
jgi:hypothetical protein